MAYSKNEEDHIGTLVYSMANKIKLQSFEPVNFSAQYITFLISMTYKIKLHVQYFESVKISTLYSIFLSNMANKMKLPSFKPVNVSAQYITFLHSMTNKIKLQSFEPVKMFPPIESHSCLVWQTKLNYRPLRLSKCLL